MANVSSPASLLFALSDCFQYKSQEALLEGRACHSSDTLRHTPAYLPLTQSEGEASCGPIRPGVSSHSSLSSHWPALLASSPDPPETSVWCSLCQQRPQCQPRYERKDTTLPLISRNEEDDESVACSTMRQTGLSDEEARKLRRKKQNLCPHRN